MLLHVAHELQCLHQYLRCLMMRIEEDEIYVLEEQVVVTESGSKVLSHAPWELQA